MWLLFFLVMYLFNKRIVDSCKLAVPPESCTANFFWSASSILSMLVNKCSRISLPVTIVSTVALYVEFTNWGETICGDVPATLVLFTSVWCIWEELLRFCMDLRLGRWLLNDASTSEFWWSIWSINCGYWMSFRPQGSDEQYDLWRWLLSVISPSGRWWAIQYMPVVIECSFVLRVLMGDIIYWLWLLNVVSSSGFL